MNARKISYLGVLVALAVVVVLSVAGCPLFEPDPDHIFAGIIIGGIGSAPLAPITGGSEPLVVAPLTGRIFELLVLCGTLGVGRHVVVFELLVLSGKLRVGRHLRST